MALKLSYQKLDLKFKFAAGTSRGTLTEKNNWIIKVSTANHPEVFGLGECGPLTGLSLDEHVNYEEVFTKTAALLLKEELPATGKEALNWVSENIDPQYPALKFALEVALLDLVNEGQRVIFKNGFLASQDGLPINGLIWMGEKQWMLDQIEQKVAEGYSCLKMKIGAIDFEEECNILESIRARFDSSKMTLRVDANGAFQTNEALLKLKRLSEYELHSIEQPIMPRQPEAMQLVAKLGKVPVALDEELIGVHDLKEREALLKFINPKYIVLKPTLLGGIRSTQQWIDIAEKLGIGWWITSALESNIGLNAICQLTAEYDITMPQGLGTGQLYENNITSPLETSGGIVRYGADKEWDFTALSL